ncbi:MAG: YihY/virulence factor BrkB family protein [Lautropia sp.]
MPRHPPSASKHPGVPGRSARQPTEIPSRGWKQILRRVVGEFGEDQVLLVAAGVTFYLLLAMVPALTALVSVYGLFADPADVERHLASLQGFLPGGAQEVVGQQLNRLVAQSGGGLGFALAGSLLLALWSANAGTKALFTAMNVAYDEAEHRGFVRLTLITMGFTIGTGMLMIALLGSVVLLPNLASLLNLGALVDGAIRLLSAVVLIAAGLAILAALYRWGPSRASARWRWITPGAIVALVVAALGSTAFSWYVGNFGSYNRTYGSLGAIIGFMTWIWLMVTVVIGGAELNAEMEHQTARDTTTGPEQPMGTRGARMADTLPNERG